VREINQKGAQVDDEEDTTIQTDWTFSTGDKRGKTESVAGCTSKTAPLSAFRPSLRQK
jgi:hypothetical protein